MSSRKTRSKTNSLPKQIKRYSEEKFIPGSSRTGGPVDRWDPGYDPDNRGYASFSNDCVSDSEEEDTQLKIEDSYISKEEYHSEQFIDNNGI